MTFTNWNDPFEPSSFNKQRQSGQPAEDFLRESTADDFLDIEGPNDEELQQEDTVAEEVLSKAALARLSDSVQIEEDVLSGKLSTEDLVFALLTFSEDDSTFAQLLARVPGYELVDAAEGFIEACVADPRIAITGNIQRNVALLTDELRTHSHTQLVSKLSDLMLMLAEEGRDLVVHGRVLLEVFDLHIERGEPDVAFVHLKEALTLLYEADYGSQLVLLPRLQTMIELLSRPEDGYEAPATVQPELECQLDRILTNAPDICAPEVLDTHLSSIAWKLNREVGVTSELLGKLEDQLYDLARQLSDKSNLQDYFGETLALLGDVFGYSGNRRGAVDSYLNAISYFERAPLDDRNDRLVDVLSETRGKAISLMLHLNLPEYADALRDNQLRYRRIEQS